ncbi:hypothetical protein Tsubulata_003438 [Turnera subulata]|uniref:Uncharacterized protein n=1 Tax=Turnera subulata TaxID=218843 RepID=A0A9Q0FUI4_9ROSI|nr:hypothetical protein Tsubulata_003438 [Turnera subulata]
MGRIGVKTLTCFFFAIGESQGVKLGLQTNIHSLAIAPGEFLVLIPFIKKDRQAAAQTPKSDFSGNLTKQSPISNLADSAYSEMMQEFSCSSEKSSKEESSGEPGNMFSGYKRRRDFESNDNRDGGDGREQQEGPYGLLWSVLLSSKEDVFEEQSCAKFVEVLKFLDCLTNPRTGKCRLFGSRGKGGRAGVGGGNASSCLCPAWLKRIMMAFAFVNIFAAFLQLRGEEIRSCRLKDAIKQLQRFGFCASYEDVVHLSILCPKVVSFVENNMKIANANDLLVIINSEMEERDEVENRPKNDRKSLSLAMIFNTMRKRESSFRTKLWEVSKSLMQKTGNAITTLEDLLKFGKERDIHLHESEPTCRKRSQNSTSSSSSFRTRCHDTNDLLPLEMVHHLKEGIGSKGQIVHVEDICARKANYVDIPCELSDNTKSILKHTGITKLYSHQAESIMASLAGKNVVVATMTSSGKSLCYNVPVLEVLSKDLSACALYLFPTKALAQDQLRALLVMTKGFSASINVGVYDGDTSQTDRPLIRANARLLITNPDMLHVSILPSHRDFSRILSNLRFVIIDEAHAYKGAFGCHTALILRRLRRLCSHVYGCNPSFIFSTATSANPREHCMRSYGAVQELANLSTLELIQNDGSPSSQKLFVLWNPVSSPTPASNASMNGADTSTFAYKSLSPISETSFLFAEMVQHGLRCIAFCKSRKLTEIVLSYTHEILQETAPHLVDLVCAYRAGYLAEDRRKIERDFFSGKLCGIAATNALELGIDVGHIDATLHLGFPGSISSLWQQAGRSGRREKSSLAVYVAFESPLDQYFMKFPNKLFNSPLECFPIDSQNQKVLEQHLICAAVEHQLSLLYDEKFFGPGLNNAVMSLKSKGLLSSDPSHDSAIGIWSYIGREKKPCHEISIRAVETVKYRVISMRCNEVLEEIEESRAFFQVYDGAVYLHQGKTYMVKELDLSEKIAWCYEASVKYYTKTRDYTDIHVLGGEAAYPARSSKNPSSRTTARANSCKVTTTWFGFYCIERGSGKVLDTFDLSLPKYSYESQAVWIQVPQSVKKTVEEKSFSFRGGLHAASHAVLNVVPLYIRCNSSDLAPECPNPHDTRYYPERILIYDQHPGGTGVSKQIQPFFTELLTAALELLTSCCCSGDAGCPNCVQSLVCHEYNEEIHKNAAIMIIKAVLDAEASYFAELRDSCQNHHDQCPEIIRHENPAQNPKQGIS